MADKFGIIEIAVSRSKSGLLTATSEALDGIYVAHRDINKIVEDMPRVIQRWFKIHQKIDVKVFVSSVEKLDDNFTIPTISVPVEIAAQAIAR
jgi:hypothetical protein